ncbi:putative disease resistance protein At1g50180 [Camellia sinensis]|uniref:putative disease resistance protein At1g50180 n=1 Tax=Camellia sinensis TaxID=4442 RepID=UPI001035FF4F|nr:putative disease resistance protein At1g50180 [Camellia sinensis]
MAEIALAGATAALRQTVGVLGNLVLKEGSRLSRLREDIVWIEREVRHIQAYLEDAEAKQGGSRGVANLVIDIRDLACDVEDIMQKYFPWIASHKGKKFSGCLKSATCIVCYGYDTRNFAVEIEGIKRRVEDINRVRQTYGINESSGSCGRDMWDERPSFPHIDEPNVVGFEKHIEDLVAKMLNKELQGLVISIIGMAGLGKTTLAKKVFKSAKHNFERSAWIYVSQQPNIRELLRDIARQVGLEKEKWEENIEVNLFTFLSEHRYVILLDDMWHIETWGAIKNAIPTNTKNGSRIILTSRNSYVGTHVGGKSSLHELRPLNKENSRKLFFKMVMVEASDPPQLENIEDHKISAFKLVNLWAAKGFIQGSGVREVEDVGDDYLNHLIARNLIQVVQRRFHGKASSNEVGNLKNLHYLGLGSTNYIEIPHTISNLRGLLTFDVRESSGCVILPDVIWTMKQLRHILLPRSCKVPPFCGINLDRIFYRTEICLPNLQTLYGLRGEVWCDFSFLYKLVNLRKLGVHSSERIIEILSDPTLVLTKLEKLFLSNIGGEILGTWNLSR